MHSVNPLPPFYCGVGPPTKLSKRGRLFLKDFKFLKFLRVVVGKEGVNFFNGVAVFT